MLLITAMTQSMPLIITVSVPADSANAYLVGQLVRLTVPKTWGMFQANGLTLRIVDINGLNFSLSIDSTNFDPFIYAISSSETPASIAPAGAQNLSFDNSTRNLPFKTFNDRGN